MKLAVRNRRKNPAQKVRPEDVIRECLATAHAIHPGHLMPGAIISALSEAGFRIISDEDFDREIAAAHQAGVEEGSAW
jgi:hypothetical protein